MAKNITIVTINSDDIDNDQIKSIRKQLRKVLKNTKIAVLAVGREDSINIQTIGSK